ncbi:DUF1476 domain-containing protein [Palleronia sp. LCG004]|uniref:DUF1476 domain-containing protein n=1 Tax=Palleronia sp. LCG004 TaxID=3079304 RepID=UPI002941EE00|nr:DUF1476 domain-containing protein [Palleronia sp. LCG004]WOI55103.1 DUF1476 domain-containing protein [Palleronia sp. LCG004]
MSDMKDRRDAFESKYAHDAEMQFRAEARRNRLLGVWAAEKLGKNGAEAEAYAKEVVKADFEEAGEEDVYRKVKGDLDDKVSEAELREKMDALMIQAKAELADMA